MKKLLLVIGAILSGLYTAGAVWGLVVSTMLDDDPRLPPGPGGLAALIAVTCIAAAVFVVCVRALTRKNPGD